MRFYSTTKKVKGVSFREALVEGFASDGGLYLPEEVACLPCEKWRGLEFPEISVEIALHLYKGIFERKDLEEMVGRAFDFPIPLIQFKDNLYALELFHGPTHSFKDVGARFMAETVRALGEELTILVATTGDTGSAVGSAFHGIPGVRVFILYPKGRVTPSQEKQITTIGDNVTAFEVEGTFDDCQALLKRAVLDPSLKRVTTGNSINIARLLPQIFYYFYALLRLPSPVEVSVPCGNFGHLVSGILAKRMGLPIKRFVAVTNINDEVPLYLESGVFTPRPSTSTVAVSMDVGNPSNFPRLKELYKGDLSLMQREIRGARFTDAEILAGIEKMYREEGYILDPHSATAYLGLTSGLFMATAHPAKFVDSVQPLIPVPIEIPSNLATTLEKEKQSVPLPNDYEVFKSQLV